MEKHNLWNHRTWCVAVGTLEGEELECGDFSISDTDRPAPEASTLNKENLDLTEK
jgi:hypothetical protein